MIVSLEASKNISILDRFLKNKNMQTNSRFHLHLYFDLSEIRSHIIIHVFIYFHT